MFVAPVGQAWLFPASDGLWWVCLHSAYEIGLLAFVFDRLLLVQPRAGFHPRKGRLANNLVLRSAVTFTLH